MRSRAFSLVELLVTIAVIAVLLAILLPTLASAREATRAVRCGSNQRQLITAWTAYANDYRERVMPLAYTSPADVGSIGEPVYWWGSYGGAGAVNHEVGFISPYIASKLSNRSVFECPNQPWGTYYPQSGAVSPTSTYGYNGYYLSPSRTPGWGSLIGRRPWRRLHEILRPTELFVFADALVPMDPPRNSALLDPPMLWDGYGWVENESPTTAFRHNRTRRLEGDCYTARAEGSVAAYHAQPDWLLYPEIGVGSVGRENGPHYIPDADEWVPGLKAR
ncbi:MAG: type II secretion system protein [Phycisphaerales bacterium]|nr:type II secretion system protein [Phycisphaerales bacterium]